MDNSLTDGQRLAAIGATLDAHVAQDDQRLDSLTTAIERINAEIRGMQKTIWLASGWAAAIISIAQLLLRAH